VVWYSAGTENRPITHFILGHQIGSLFLFEGYGLVLIGFFL